MNDDVLMRRLKYMMGTTVKRRAESIEQPPLGYLPLSQFRKCTFDDGYGFLYTEGENIPPQLMGTVVEYLVRSVLLNDFRKGFEDAIKGFQNAAPDIVREQNIEQLLLDASELESEKALTSACRLAYFDNYYKSPKSVVNAKPANLISPDKNTCKQLLRMVSRGINLFEQYGPVIKTGFTFEPNGYTEIVSKGEGDFLTEDTIWDFKLYGENTRISKAVTLQLLMYWIMGRHSGNSQFDTVEKIAFFNPRSNVAYMYQCERINSSIISEIEQRVIGYPSDKET